MTKKQEPSHSQKKHIRKASKSLEKMHKKIAPFIKELEIVEYSTDGKWDIPSSFEPIYKDMGQD